jgi:MinD-like ATPase involved in chromosome partitioning or flagellar assembly
VSNQPPVRILVIEANPTESFALQKAAFDHAAAEVVAVSSTLDGALQDLGYTEAEVVILDGSFARDDPSGFLEKLDQIAAVVIILLPPGQTGQKVALRSHPQVQDVIHKPASPTQVVRRATELGLQERERLYEVDPLAHRQVLTGHQTQVGEIGGQQQVICVTAFKGGTGKSTVAENLWYAINANIGPALLVSLDVPDDHAIWLRDLRPTPNLSTFARQRGARGLEASTQHVAIGGGRWAPIILAPSTHAELRRIELDRYTELILRARDEYGAIIIDTPPTITADTLTVMTRSNRVLLVMEPNNADVQKVAVGLQALEHEDVDEELRVPRERIVYVLNMVHPGSDLRPRGVEARLKPELGWSPAFVGQIPYDPDITPWQNNGVIAYSKSGPVADAIDQILTHFFPAQRQSAQRRSSRGGWRDRLPRVRIG